MGQMPCIHFSPAYQIQGRWQDMRLIEEGGQFQITCYLNVCVSRLQAYQAHGEHAVQAELLS